MIVRAEQKRLFEVLFLAALDGAHDRFAPNGVGSEFLAHFHRAWLFRYQGVEYFPQRFSPGGAIVGAQRPFQPRRRSLKDLGGQPLVYLHRCSDRHPKPPQHDGAQSAGTRPSNVIKIVTWFLPQQLLVVRF